MKMKSASFFIFYILFQQGQIMKTTNEKNHITMKLFFNFEGLVTSLDTILEPSCGRTSFSSLLVTSIQPFTSTFQSMANVLMTRKSTTPSTWVAFSKMLVCLNLWDNCEVQQRQKETTSWRRNNNETGQKQTDNHTPIETDWETNNGKPDCIGLVLGEGKLSGNLWVKEDIGGVRFEISDRQPNDSLALCSLERKY